MPANRRIRPKLRADRLYPDLGARFRVVFPSAAHCPPRSPETNRRSIADDERLSVSGVSAIDSTDRDRGASFRCSMSYVG